MAELDKRKLPEEQARQQRIRLSWLMSPLLLGIPSWQTPTLLHWIGSIDFSAAITVLTTLGTWTSAAANWFTSVAIPGYLAVLPHLGMPAMYLIAILLSIWLPPYLDPNPQPVSTRSSRRRHQQAIRRWQRRPRFKTASIKDTKFHKSYPRRLRSQATYWTKAPPIDQQHLLYCMNDWFHHSSNRKAGHKRDREWHPEPSSNRRKGDYWKKRNNRKSKSRLPRNQTDRMIGMPPNVSYCGHQAGYKPHKY